MTAEVPGARYSTFEELFVPREGGRSLQSPSRLAFIPSFEG